MSSIPIYRIHVYEEGSNSHSVARSERWEIKIETECANLDEAKQYVRENSRLYTILPNKLQQWRETKTDDRTVTQEELIEQFCFTNDQFLKDRRLFIQKPNIKANNIKKKKKNHRYQLTISIGKTIVTKEL